MKLILYAGRALLPLSLLVALVLSPSALLRPLEILRVARQMWDDPL
jgi:hypothetical protein